MSELEVIEGVSSHVELTDYRLSLGVRTTHVEEI